MIVNSSRGGGSKDTWVLEDGPEAPTDRAEPPGRVRRRRRMPDLQLRRPGPARTATAAAASGATDARPDRPRAVLARTLRRARRAHRADARRRLPGDPAGSPRGPAGSKLGLGLAAGGHGRPRRAAALVRPATTSLRTLTLDPDNPASVVACVARAREGARTRARRRLGRDVGGDQHDRPRPARQRPRRGRCAPARTRSTRTSRERCALFWGLAGAHDAARRGLRVPRRRRPHRGRPTWCCGCCASRCPSRRRRRPPSAARRSALLQAVGGFQAFRRAVPAPPNAVPGRALPAVRARLPGLGRRGVASARCTRARARRRATRATPSRSCAWQRLSAELEFHRRAEAARSRPAT